MKNDELEKIYFELKDISLKLSKLVDLTEIGQKHIISKIREETLGKSKLTREIYELCNGKTSVGELSRLLKQKQPNISKYLDKLEKSGLVKYVKRGREKYYYKI